MRCHISNSLLGTLNFITFLLSIPIVIAQIWLSRHSQTECQIFLHGPMLAFGIVLFVVSLCGLVGACCKNSLLMWIYLFMMFVLIVLIFCFTIFAFVVTNKGAGEAVSGKGYKQYRLGDYSHWLQKTISESKNWGKIRSCLVDLRICPALASRNMTDNQFSRQDLSPLESGCCKPPDDCGFKYQGPISWRQPNDFGSNNPDCVSWNNDVNKLCYDCEACKAGILATLKKDWRKIAIVNIIFLIFLIIVYSVGCCAFRNNRMDNGYRMKGYP